MLSLVTIEVIKYVSKDYRNPALLLRLNFVDFITSGNETTVLVVGGASVVKRTEPL